MPDGMKQFEASKTANRTFASSSSSTSIPNKDKSFASSTSVSELHEEFTEFNIRISSLLVGVRVSDVSEWSVDELYLRGANTLIVDMSQLTLSQSTLRLPLRVPAVDEARSTVQQHNHMTDINLGMDHFSVFVSETSSKHFRWKEGGSRSSQKPKPSSTTTSRSSARGPNSPQVVPHNYTSAPLDSNGTGSSSISSKVSNDIIRVKLVSAAIRIPRNLRRPNALDQALSTLGESLFSFHFLFAKLALFSFCTS